MFVKVTRTDVEQCEAGSTLRSWFGAVNANDVNTVEGMIQQHTADVNAVQVQSSFLLGSFEDPR